MKQKLPHVQHDLRYQRPTFISQFVKLRSSAVCRIASQLSVQRVNTARSHPGVGLNIWRQMCDHRSEQTCSLPQVLSSQTCWGVKQCEFTHQFLRSLLLFIDLSDRSIGFVSRSSLDGGAEDNPVSDWLNPGVAPGEWLTFMGLTVAALLSLNASLFATQTKVG